MMTLSPDFRRVLALLLLLTLAVAIYGLVVEPVLALNRRLDQRWVEGEARLFHYHRVAGMLDQLREIDARLRLATEGAAAYVEAPSATLAAAQLEDRLGAVTRERGAELIGTRVLDGAEEGEFQRVGLHVTLTATLAQLQSTIHALEAHVPILFIDGLSIQRRDAGTDAGPAGTDPQLDVAFDLFAYRRQR